MVVTKRKKNSRQLGGTTNGWGARNKHRGKGNKGGCGNAGTGKRGDTNKPKIWKNKNYFGKKGFKKKGIIKEIVPINISILQSMLDKLVQAKKITLDGDSYTIDLKTIGYNRLLGTGNVTKKMKITTEFASQKAIEKIAGNNGEVVVTTAKEESE